MKWARMEAPKKCASLCAPLRSTPGTLQRFVICERFKGTLQIDILGELLE